GRGHRGFQPRPGCRPVGRRHPRQQTLHGQWFGRRVRRVAGRAHIRHVALTGVPANLWYAKPPDVVPGPSNSWYLSGTTSISRLPGDSAPSPTPTPVNINPPDDPGTGPIVASHPPVTTSP